MNFEIFGFEFEKGSWNSFLFREGHKMDEDVSSMEHGFFNPFSILSWNMQLFPILTNPLESVEKAYCQVFMFWTMDFEFYELLILHYTWVSRVKIMFEILRLKRSNLVFNETNTTAQAG